MTLALDYGTRMDGSRATLDLSRWDAFVMITGAHGAGKTTLAERFADAAAAQGAAVRRAPDGDRLATYGAIAEADAELTRRQSQEVDRASELILVLDGLDQSLSADEHATTYEARRAPFVAKERFKRLHRAGAGFGIRLIWTWGDTPLLVRPETWIHLSDGSAESMAGAFWLGHARSEAENLAAKALSHWGKADGLRLALSVTGSDMSVARVALSEED